jgi:Ca2+-binding EF-hand superfamily protein
MRRARKVIGLIGLLGVSGAAVAAPLAQQAPSTAKRFLESLDRNGDGVVSRAEWLGAGATFQKIDADHDGYLSLDELAHVNGPAPATPPPPPKDAPPDSLALDRIAVPLRDLVDPPAVFEERCLQCHDQMRIVRAQKSADGWRDTVTRMKNKKAAKITDKEAKTIVDWLLAARAPLAKIALTFGSDDPKRDWAVVIGGGDLELFDRDHNGRLDAGELARLVFERVDIDRSGGLSPGEFSLLPLSTQRRALFAKFDRDHDGSVSPRELGLMTALVELCDTNADNMVSREELPRVRQVGGPYPMILAADAKTALELLDQNRDGRLSHKELDHFPGTLARFDENKDGELDVKELETAVTAARAEGPYAAFDDFFTRYDLDQDGVVTRLEFPGSNALFARFDVDGDGSITAKDAPAGLKRPEFTPDALRWRQ